MDSVFVWCVFKYGDKSISLACYLSQLPAMLNFMACEGYILEVIKPCKVDGV
jgi:hypothetical protein